MPKGVMTNTVGLKFNHLTVLEEISKNGEKYCKCMCDCGNIKLIRKQSVTSGITKTCANCPSKFQIGYKQGMLTIVEKVMQNGKKMYLCKCDCGNTKLISHESLKAGTRSCGCLHKQKEYDNLIGKKYGKLLVIKEVEKTSSSQRRFLCKCDCGKEKIVLGSNLIYGESTSCGCNRGYVENTKINLLKIEKAYPTSKSGIKGVWQNKEGFWYAIITVSRKRMVHYGGRGEEGKNNCIVWRKDMVEKYHKPLIEKYSNL